MKSFFQLSEQAKRHASRKMLNEADPAAPAAAAGTPPAAGTPQAAAQKPATPAPTTPAQPAAPDYKTFLANWTNFAKDPVNTAAIQAMSKTIPALATFGQEIQKLAAAPAPAPAK